VAKAEKILKDFKPVTYDVNAQLKAIDAFESKAVSADQEVMREGQCAMFVMATREWAVRDKHVDCDGRGVLADGRGSTGRRAWQEHALCLAAWLLQHRLETRREAMRGRVCTDEHRRARRLEGEIFEKRSRLCARCSTACRDEQYASLIRPTSDAGPPSATL
jgi:hypothetical protein